MVRLMSGLVLGTMLCATAAQAEAPRVVVSLAPLHSLVAGVMEGVGTPELLIKAGASPHDATLRPSDARALAAADLVVWVGPELETALAKPIAARAGKARLLGVAELETITLLDARVGGAWDEHDDHADHAEEGHADHGDHAEEDHAEEDHSDHADHAEEDHSDHADHAEEDHSDHADHAEEKHERDAHDHGHHDLHLWLDPGNGQAIVAAAVEALSEIDPANSGRYRDNGERVLERIAALDKSVAAQLRPLSTQPYVVFHDAYQYFERHYGLRPVGAISVSPDRPPGARRLSEMRDQIERLNVICVFAEPQFPPALVATLVRGTKAKSGVLDPLGAALAPGSDAYFAVMQGLADGLADCLVPES